MSKVAFLFPGQGSQSPGMGRSLAETFPTAQEVFQEADQALGFSLSRLCFEGPAEELRLTANSQPAILAVSVAAYRVLQEKWGCPDYLAGHSLGEYSALVAGGALSFRDALPLVRKRGEYMQEAVPDGEGSMAALMGLDARQVEAVCREAAQNQVVAPANFNFLSQIVIAGHTAAVNRAMEVAKQRGARRTLTLNVSAPFHCSLMKPAAEKLARDLDATLFHPLERPLVNNVDAQLVRTPEKVRDGLKRQVSAPVRWVQSMQYLIEAGTNHFVEVGPGKVLTGLLKQIDRQVNCFPIEGPEGLGEALRELEPLARASA